ncbi:MAG: DUF4158 domain-containing protein, partial [SAR324 cluster bacterium]|nr:DUF4158 domain-containing protein [SAR324 cluster bacterium]
MSTLLNILSTNEQKTFENPPQFSGVERKQTFFLNQKLEDIASSMRTPTNQVGFVLQFGYFQ